MATFGTNLREARIRAGLTQDALAERLHFKRQTPLSIWERDRKLPGPKTIEKLAHAIGCSTAELMAGVTSPYDLLRAPGTSAPPEERFTDAERHLVAVYRQLSPNAQARLVPFLEGVALTGRAGAHVPTPARRPVPPAAAARTRRARLGR
jgi:transcriptional regulator with XRE-family HTH domain